MTIAPISFDLPMVAPTVRELLAAMAEIQEERPEQFEPLLERAGILTAGAAKLMVDAFSGERAGWVDYTVLGAALARIAINLPEIGRDGLAVALIELSDLSIRCVPPHEQEAKVKEMTMWVTAVFAVFEKHCGGIR